MRIKNLQLNLKDIERSGIGEFKCIKFNSVIALVGKNGSGKSRYLKAIENHLLNTKIDADFEHNFSSFPNSFTEAISLYKKYPDQFELYQELNELNTQLAKSPNNKEITEKIRNIQIKASNTLSRNGQFFSKSIKDVKSDIANRLKVINSDHLRKLQSSFDTKQKVSFQNIIDSTAEVVEVNEISLITESALTYLQRLPHKLAYDEIDCRGDEKKFKNRVSYQRFKLLSQLINDFLDKTLEWHSKNSDVNEFDDHVSIKTTGYWTINKREFNFNDFSDGEKVLFTYALLLFLLSTNPRIKFNESIIIIDEPELNLHPKAQIKLIETLKNLINEKGQLIIATHSLSILANLDYGSIFLVRDNQLYTPSSSVPFDAIEDLMGFEEHYNKIVEFLVSTPAWAMTNFMAQCFENPDVFESASKNDPQLEIFKNLVLKSSDLHILDFGSGKGRLIDRIKESQETWSRIFRYDCFDIEKNYNDLVISKGANNIFNDLKEIKNDFYDLIIVVNVLHEIHISHWTNSLNKIKNALKPNGYLAIIEDTELPIGELPNELGFLILNQDEMKNLLGEKTQIITPESTRYNNRIICGLVQKEQMKTINKKNLLNTLNLMKNNSLEKIREYRDLEDKDLKIGRLYALKANLFVNSQLAINLLEGDQKT